MKKTTKLLGCPYQLPVCASGHPCNIVNRDRPWLGCHKNHNQTGTRPHFATSDWCLAPWYLFHPASLVTSAQGEYAVPAPLTLAQNRYPNNRVPTKSPLQPQTVRRKPQGWFNERFLVEEVHIHHQRDEEKMASTTYIRQLSDEISQPNSVQPTTASLADNVVGVTALCLPRFMK